MNFTPSRPDAARRVAHWFVVCSVAALLGSALMPTAHAQDASALRARYAALRDKLADNQFHRPLYLEATQTSGDLKGDVYATVEHPYTTVLPALQSLGHWCDILILHLNVKQCKAGAGQLTLDVGRKYDQAAEDAYRLEFLYKVIAATPEYLQVQLGAAEGPFGTRNYLIVVEVIPLDDKRSFIHMSYAYGYGFAARMALQTYLATVGRDKVGFTIVGNKADGQPNYVGGVLGLLERNTMRYYLAIEAYLASYALPPTEQVEQSIRGWYASTERYARQLHEMDQNDYLEMKRKEVARMTAAAR